MPPARAGLAARRSGLVAALLSLQLTACGSGERAAPPPTQPPGGTDTIGTIRRATLTVQVTVDPADAAVATALGISPSQPAQLTVQAVRGGASTEPPRTAVTDQTGRARFEGLLEGQYTLSVERTLDDAMRAALPESDRDITAFGGGGSLRVAPGESSTSISVVAGRRGSLVISEIWPYRPNTAAGPYIDGTYLELYNNSDSTVYLDGVLFGILPGVSRNIGDVPPNPDFCAIYESIRDDASALPLRTLVQIPGSGTEHPVPPGGAVLIAQDAINHREFAPTAIDLSSAAFEAIGDARDVDNPAVPDLIRLTPLTGIGPFGRGVVFGTGLPDGYVLARAPSVPLERRTIGDSSNAANVDVPFVRREDVLDVAFLGHSPAATALLAAAGLPSVPCSVPWNPTWERAAAPIVFLNDYEFPRAFVRRTAYVRADGRVVLQRTRTSARDWVYGPPASPGVVR